MIRALGAPALLAALGALAACALRPVYDGGVASDASALLAAVRVAPIPDRAGFLVRDRIESRLAAVGEAAARYRLEVRLDDRIEGFGVRGDNRIVRERRTLRARWRLVEMGTDAVLLEAVAGSDAGVDVVSSEYAVVAAEVTALERLAEAVADEIVARLATWARGGRR